MIPVSKQGYHMWEQGTRGWKLDVLTTLSKILSFKIVIEDGKLEISEHIKESNDINTENNKSEVNNMISKTELEKFEIVKLYTDAENINFDERNILDECLVYSDKEEAMHTFNTIDTLSLIPIYALYDKEADTVCFNTFGLDKTKAYSIYFWNYAPILDEDNTVYIDSAKDIKVSRMYATLDTMSPNPDGTFPIISLSTKPEDNTLGIFVTTNLSGEIIPQINFASEDFPNII